MAGHELVGELAAGRGRYALIDGGPLANQEPLVGRLSADLQLRVARLGAVLAQGDGPPSRELLESVCGDATVLADIDVLCSPNLDVDITAFLAARARRLPTIAVWPGVIADGRARYSVPGRPDHHDERLRNTIVLRPRTVRFPDEVPYSKGSLSLNPPTGVGARFVRPSIVFA